MPAEKSESSEYQPKLSELISLRQAAQETGLSPNHLRLLVGRGDIWGIKIDYFWVTTKEAVSQYMARDRRPGPKNEK